MLASWLILTVAFFIAAAIVPGFEIRSFGSAIIAAAIFGIINTLFGWFIFIVLGIASLGIGFLLAFITRVITNAILLKITDALTDRLTIRGFGAAIFGAMVIGVIGTVGDWLLRPGMGRGHW